MTMPKDEIRAEMNNAWETYLTALEKSIGILENEITEAKDMAGYCTGEWCEATEHLIDELNNSLFSISEPRWADADDSRRIKLLKRKVYDLYVNYKGVFQKLSA